MTQLSLPGVRMRPNNSDVRALVLMRLAGFEHRQRQREYKRKLRQWLSGGNPKGFNPDAIGK